MDIDAVITWVDGSDPALVEKRARYMGKQADGRKPSRNASQSRRFSDNDEIRYCLRSIRNYAPWVRRIWIVTDGQVPACIDPERAREAGIEIVDHRHIFRGYEELLPTFNSNAIESFLWRIEGLADRFLYFNDDVFLTRRVRPTTFFRGNGVVLRGNWVESSAGASLSAYAQYRLNAAEMLGFGRTRLFANAHVMHPMRRTVFEALFRRFEAEFIRNARFRFRSREQFGVTSLHNHFAIGEGLARTKRPWDVVHFPVKFCRDGSAAELNAQLKRLRRWWTIGGCLNYIEAVAEKVPDVVEQLDRITGAAAPFERAVA